MTASDADMVMAASRTQVPALTAVVADAVVHPKEEHPGAIQRLRSHAIHQHIELW